MMNKLAQDIAAAVQVKLAASNWDAGLRNAGMITSGAARGLGPGAVIGAGIGSFLGALRKPQQSFGQELLTNLGLAQAPSRFRNALKGGAIGAGIGGLTGAGIGGGLGYTYGQDHAKKFLSDLKGALDNREDMLVNKPIRDLVDKNLQRIKENPQGPKIDLFEGIDPIMNRAKNDDLLNKFQEAYFRSTEGSPEDIFRFGWYSGKHGYNNALNGAKDYLSNLWARTF